MYFRMLHDEATGAMSYLLADLAAGEAVLIDPRGEDLPVLAAMLAEHRLRLAAWLRTHAHDDRHPGEAETLAAGLGAPCIRSAVPPGGIVAFGDEHLRVLATPGHTHDDLSFLWRDRLFCGGLLAVDACPDQPWPANPQALWDSVMREVFQRPAETLVFGGHSRRGRSVSSVHEQRRWHPWFAGAGRDEFLARVRELPSAAAVIDRPPPSRAFAASPARPMRPSHHAPSRVNP